jgi:hypothetical protein
MGIEAAVVEMDIEDVQRIRDCPVREVLTEPEPRGTYRAHDRMDLP